ncbi:MAG: aryl-alcohol dehydrogenase [Desulfobulbus propionicus]|nr:MAG: aryl-alcohol dehydrogenase [Desulfobulbus propionicus]
MKEIEAAVVNGVNEEYKIESIYVDEPKANEVLVKIVASGICHSDEAFRLGDAEYGLPAVFGHEGAGIVEEVGEAVKTVKAGDHVILSYAFCGHCHSCLRGKPATCSDWVPLNVSGRRGNGEAVFYKKDKVTPIGNFLGQSSFATHTVVDEKNITKIDRSVDLRLVGPLGCGFLTGSGTVFNGFQPEIGSTLTVFGTGTVGLAAMMAAKISAFSEIIAVDIHDHRLETSKKMGATHTINSKNIDAAEEIKKVTNGLGTDYVIDTTGVSEVMKTALDVTAQGGVYAPLAVTNKDFNISPFVDVVVGTKNIKGVLMGDAIPQLSIPQLIDFYNKDLFPFDVVIKKFDFEQINEAANASNSGEVIKPVIIIDKTYMP